MNSPTSKHNFQSQEIEITVGVCTYGRKELRETLLSLSAQKLPIGTSMTVLVADNAEKPIANEIITPIAEQTGLRVKHLYAPPYNISTARNTILEATETTWLAFIDDDEIADENWLALLLIQALATDGDAIFGPVHAIYPDDVPAWIKKGDFHSTDITFVGGDIVTGYSCNALIKLTSACFKGMRFDPGLGSTGGEDTEFFATAHSRGGRLFYAPEAVVYEPVPEDRANFKWLFRRRFRSGQTHARPMLKKALLRRCIAFMTGTAKVGFCLAGALITSPFGVSRRRWLLRGGLHMGYLAKLSGMDELRIYSKS